MAKRQIRLNSIWTEVGGLRMHARVRADLASAGASAVVLVHGLGVSSRYMCPTARLLAPWARVYAPDLPGFGRSSRPRAILTVPQLADALAGWLTAQGISRASLIGNSLGCEIVVDLAVRRPELVERLVLLGPTEPPERRSLLKQMLYAAPDIPLERVTLWPGLLWDYLVAGPRRVLRTLQHMIDYQIERQLPLVQAPTLVVRGGKDPIIPQAWAEQVVALLPCGRLAVIPGGSHAVNYSYARELLRLLRPFLGLGPAQTREVGQSIEPAAR